MKRFTFTVDDKSAADILLAIAEHVREFRMEHLEEATSEPPKAKRSYHRAAADQPTARDVVLTACKDGKPHAVEQLGQTCVAAGFSFNIAAGTANKLTREGKLVRLGHGPAAFYKLAGL